MTSNNSDNPRQIDEEPPTWTVWEDIVAALATFILLISFPISVWFCLKTVETHQNAVIFRLGKLKPGGVRGPGLVFRNPLVDTCWIINMQERVVPVEKSSRYYLPNYQIGKTQDGRTVVFLYRAYYKVVCPSKSVTKLNNLDDSVEQAISDKVRDLVAQLELAQLTNSTSNFETMLCQAANQDTEKNGVQIQRLVIYQFEVARE